MTFNPFIIYNLIAFLCALFASISSTHGKHNHTGIRVVALSAMFLTMFLPAALRYDIGTDYKNYVEIYNILKNGGSERLEPIYLGLNYLVIGLDVSYQWIFVATSLIMFLCLIKLSRERLYWVFISIFIFSCYLNGYSSIRQYTAVSLLIIAVYQLLNSKKKSFLFITLLAAGFHVSSLLLLPFYYSDRIKLNRYISLLLIIIFYILITQLGLINIIFNNSFFLETKYAAYATNKFNVEVTEGSGIGIILRMCIPTLYIFLQEKIVNFSTRRILNALCLSYVISLIFSSQIQIFNRLVDLFSFVPALLAMYLAAAINKKSNRIIIISLMILVSAATFEKNIEVSDKSLNSGLGISPYTSIL
ncbi:EpsG family protein [Erwinia aphidicola]|uniref:EpsG family protein n=1 Tax=Erwinia aphidicola TaxID=68334 RepID=UPI00209FC1FA|nr:hypothetical protein [Erwinia aphidicola]